MCFEAWVLGSNSLLKMFKNVFQRILMLRNIFRIFVKVEKGATKVPACKSGSKDSNIQWVKFKNREKQMLWKIKYEISTDLPSARARRFESDERDLSPSWLTICRPVLEKWTKMRFLPCATLSWIFFSLVVSLKVLLPGVLVPPRAGFHCEPARS